MSIEAVVACAGSGRRLKAGTLKPLVDINGSPIFVHTIKALSRCRLIDRIILVVRPGKEARFASSARKYHLKKIKAIIPGGKTRTQSVRNGLKILDRQTSLVVVHDAARPLVSVPSIERVIKAARKFGAAVLAAPVSSTVQKVNPAKLEVEGILDRRRIWEVQTPQVFKKAVILKAYKNFNGQASDDATLVKRTGQRVKVVRGSSRNIKITTPEDLKLAKILLKRRG